MNKENKRNSLLYILIFLTSITGAIGSTGEVDDPAVLARRIGMGDIIAPNPPNLRLLQWIMNDLAGQEGIIPAGEYETIKPFLTTAPIFQANTYPVSHQLWFFITDTAVSSLTQEELYFIVGHELGHQHNSLGNPDGYDLQQEILADQKGLYALAYHLGGKDHLAGAIKVIHKVLDKIGSYNNGLTPCYREHESMLQGKEISSSIRARKDALEDHGHQIKSGIITDPLLEGIKIQEIEIDKQINNIEVKFSVVQEYIDEGYTYRKLMRLYQKKGERWEGIWKYDETKALKAKHTAFRTSLAETELSPGKYKVWVKLFVLDNKMKTNPVATAQARAFFELE